MRRRSVVIGGLAALLLTRERSGAQEQPNKVPRVGVLSPAENEATPIFVAFRHGLRELGYVEGRNIILEFRLANGDHTALRRLAEELASLPVNVIVTDASASAQAAANATRTIPIVLGVIGDPVALGLVNNLARPGGNITGFTNMWSELTVKRFDLMRMAFPSATEVTVLLNPSNFAEANFSITEGLARRSGLGVARVEAASPEVLRGIGPEALGRAGGAVLVLPDAMFWNHRRDIVGLITAAHLPAIYPEREYADDGGLIAYGSNVPENFRLAAGYVDRILKGAKPGDLPIQEPVKFDFVVNLKTAKALGLTIPPSILAGADEVIE
jgi:putative ABC transport system substrate-binding protein